jgi:hypothetical protein
MVDEQLSWKDHIAKVTKKLNILCGVVSRIRNFLPSVALKMIYNSLGHSSILYGIEVWGTCYPSSLLPLARAQRKLLRVISKTHRRETSLPLFKLHKILPVYDEIQLRQSLLAFKLIKKPGETSLRINTQFQHTYGTRFSHQNIPIPTCRLARTGTKGIRSSLINAYNRIPNELKQLEYHRFFFFKRKMASYYRDKLMSRAE